MKCPRCNSENLMVVDSRGGDDSTIRRRRECDDCKFRFTTYERIELTLPMVIKKDGRREEFSRDKLRGGLLRACEKRPVGMEILEQTIDLVERKVHELCVKELPSAQIGDLLMEELRGLDPIAYVRFASVDQEFSDLNQFADTLRSLKRERDRARSGSELHRAANQD